MALSSMNSSLYAYSSCVVLPAAAARSMCWASRIEASVRLLSCPLPMRRHQHVNEVIGVLRVDVGVQQHQQQLHAQHGTGAQPFRRRPALTEPLSVPSWRRSSPVRPSYRRRPAAAVGCLRLPEPVCG